MPDLNTAESARPKSLSQETADKGEAFILAMIAEGRSYKSMKAAFNQIVLRTQLRLNHGVVSDAAEEMGVARRLLFVWIKEFGMGKEVEGIRAAANANGAEK
jgi:DNA-binding NtrC family response regulator